MEEDTLEAMEEDTLEGLWELKSLELKRPILGEWERLYLSKRRWFLK
jgi:hypothetical protein